MRKLFLKIVLLFVVALMIGICLLWVWPVDTGRLASNPDPASSYQEASERIAFLMEQDDDPDVADYCRSIFLSHGHKTQQAVVMYHGYTNCPRQYEVLARMFFERGCNVYIPRIPHHGSRNRLNPPVGLLTLDDLVSVVDHSVDVAQGLGEEITVLGLSLGGVMSAWAAQFRDDIDAAVILVPSFGWYYLPGVVKPLLNLAYFLPDALLWWHPRQRENRPIPYSMYHKFSSRGMGHTLMMSLAVLRASQQRAPSTKRILVMTTDLDRAVDDKNIHILMNNWSKRGVKIAFYQLPESLGIEHDIIDPLQPYQKAGLVYQKIFEMIDQQ